MRHEAPLPRAGASFGPYLAKHFLHLQAFRARFVLKIAEEEFARQQLLRNTAQHIVE